LGAIPIREDAMKGITLTTLALLALTAATVPAAAQNGRDLFQQALVKERAEGDLRRAIALYEQIARDFAADHQLAARALVQLGAAYEKLGSTEAERAYQRVVRDYADQGELVAQARSRLAALAPAAANGGGPVARRLLSGEDTDLNNLFFMTPSPDGRRLAYADLTLGGLHVHDLATGEVEDLLPGLPTVWNFAPVWSPDGRRIAFSETAITNPSTSIKIIDLGTREVMSIPGTTKPYTGSGESTGMTPADWSRDGRYILFRDGELSRPVSIGFIPVSGGTATVLADSVAGGDGIPAMACFSPDGRWVAYAAGPKGSEQVFVKAIAGGAPRPVTSASGGNNLPLWSPGGGAIAYQRPEGIWVVPVANGQAVGPARLVYASTATRIPAAWTENGLYVSISTSLTIPYQLVVDPGTGEPSGVFEELPSHPAVATSFAWSPDRKRIAFVSSVSGSAEIALYGDGGRSVTTYRPSEPSDRISRLRWSADGREVLYVSSVRATRTSRTMALDPITLTAREALAPVGSRVPYQTTADGRYTLYYQPAAPADSIPGGLVVVERGRPEGRLVAPSRGPDGAPLSNVLALSPQGELLLFSRQAGSDISHIAPDAGSLWLVATDGSGTPRRLGSAQRMLSAVWDPSGRFVAYTAMVTETKPALRIVEAATGSAREVPLPQSSSGEASVVDWSTDGTHLGITVPSYRAEYWLLQNLQGGTQPQ